MQPVPRLAILVAAAGLLAGCSRPESAVATGDRDQVLHLGNKDEPADLDPHINTASSTSTILSSLYQGLVTPASDGVTVLPGDAERWETSADGLTLTFHIRRDVRWSNGEALTAEDYRQSFLRILDPKLGCELSGYTFAIKGARDYIEGRQADPSLVGLRVPDPHTLVVVLDYPAPYLFKVLGRAPFYPVYLRALDTTGGRSQRGGAWTLPGVLVSNGPFTLAEWKPNASIRVVRNPNYWDAGRVRLREIRFYPIDDEAAEERSFRAGQLHVTYRLPKTKVPVYESEHPGELHLTQSLRTNFVTFNVTRAPFTDPRVRRAFSLAIDRERLVGAALGKLGAPAHSFVRPGTGGYVPAGLFRFDPAEAASQLAAAGYPGGAGLPPVELTLNGNTGVALTVAEVLKEMWKTNLGVRVDVRAVEFKVYLSIERERQFQILTEGYSYISDPRDLLEGIVTGDPNNDAGASNPDIDRALDASDHALDPAGRWAAFDAMEAVNAREVYYAPIYFPNRGMLVGPSVKGWRDNSLGIIDWREISLGP